MIELLSSEENLSDGCYIKIRKENLEKYLKEYFDINLSEQQLENNDMLEAMIAWVILRIFTGRDILIQIKNDEVRIFE